MIKLFLLISFLFSGIYAQDGIEIVVKREKFSLSKQDHDILTKNLDKKFVFLPQEVADILGKIDNTVEPLRNVIQQVKAKCKVFEINQMVVTLDYALEYFKSDERISEIIADYKEDVVWGNATIIVFTQQDIDLLGDVKDDQEQTDRSVQLENNFDSIEVSQIVEVG